MRNGPARGKRVARAPAPRPPQMQAEQLTPNTVDSPHTTTPLKKAKLSGLDDFKPQQPGARYAFSFEATLEIRDLVTCFRRRLATEGKRVATARAGRFRSCVSRHSSHDAVCWAHFLACVLVRAGQPLIWIPVRNTGCQTYQALHIIT